MPVRIIFIMLLCVWAVITDISDKKIPNYLVFSFMLGGVIYNGLNEGLSGLTTSISGTLLPLLVLFPFFLMRTLGAGDIKLFMAIGSFAGLGIIINIILYSILAGGVIALIIMFLKNNIISSLKNVCIYIKNTIIMKKIIPYKTSLNQNSSNVFRFSYAILIGVFTAVYAL
jgi:prepilin peptidase CpaA